MRTSFLYNKTIYQICSEIFQAYFAMAEMQTVFIMNIKGKIE